MGEPPTGQPSGDEPKPASDSGGENPRRIESGSRAQRRTLSYESPRALSYESLRDVARREPALNVVGMTFACGIGFAVAAVGVLFLSGYVYMGAHNSTRITQVCAAVYFLLFAAAIFGVVRLFKAPGWREVGRWWAFGMLLGAGAGMLVEGICFAAQT
ncbi:MAG: hypothetical protein JWL69_3851 [Phycisphaerales bacterium]|jgi:hypothetical protein|nr:hypothetical protein [Phycisphaerales bacterium]MDB5358100.1 hypothetical protein [Phycisphaerales bacterium]